MYFDDSSGLTHYGRNRINHKLVPLADSVSELHCRIDTVVMAATPSAAPSSSITYPVNTYAACDPLPEGTIRLLVLHAGKKGQSIDCSMFTAIMDSTPSYEALSYAWGTSHDLKSLVLNGEVCQTRHNLVDCLRDLRQHNTSRVLWIDALCMHIPCCIDCSE
jgi:hypothetical protein